MKTSFPDDTRHRLIQLGCGPHPLPSPWENYDREVDISKPLPFPSESVYLLFAEHVIEHLPFASGLAFLLECLRVLEPGGTLRLCFPDVSRFMMGDYELIDERAAAYCQWLEHGPPGIDHANIHDVYKFILAGSGHKSAWTQFTGTASLRAVGFPRVWECLYSDSEHPELRNIERHHFSVPESVAIAETTILEATK